MAHQIEVEIMKSTKSTNGGFINTLKAFQVVKSDFGSRTIERKLFIKSDDEIKVGKKMKIDLDNYDVTTVQEMYEGKPVAKTWLKPKTALSAVRDVARVIDNRATTVSGNVNF